MFRVIKWLSQIGCDHSDIRRFGGSHMWVECLKCGRESSGIRPKAPTAARLRATAEMRSPLTIPSPSNGSLKTAA